MNHKKKVFALLVFSFAFALPAFAQFTQVSATVVDPNSIPYAYGSVSAILVTPGGGPGAVITTTGQSCCGPRNAVLDGNGAFVMQLEDNALVTPASTKWQFTVNETPGIQPPLGYGSVSFSVTLTITGATQSISTQLNAAAPALGRSSGGGGTPGGSNTQMQFNDSSSFGGDPDFLYVKGTHTHSTTASGVFDFSAATITNFLFPATGFTNGHLLAVNKSGGTFSLADGGSAGSGTVTQSSSAQYQTAAFTTATNVTGIGPGTSGQCYMSNGASANPSFQSCGGSGTVTVSGSPAQYDSAYWTSGTNLTKVTAPTANGLYFKVYNPTASAAVAPTALLSTSLPAGTAVASLDTNTPGVSFGTSVLNVNVGGSPVATFGNSVGTVTATFVGAAGTPDILDVVEQDGSTKAFTVGYAGDGVFAGSVTAGGTGGSEIDSPIAEADPSCASGAAYRLWPSNTSSANRWKMCSNAGLARFIAGATALDTTATHVLHASADGAAGTYSAIVGADLPAPGASSLGGVESVTCPAGQHINTISTGGVPGCTADASGSGIPIPSTSIYHVVLCQPDNSSSSLTCFGENKANDQGTPSLISSTTATDPVMEINYATGTVSGNNAGFYSNNPDYFSTRIQTVSSNARLVATTTERYWLGYSDGGACFTSDTPGSGSSLNCAGIAFSTPAGDTNFMCVAAGTSSQTRTSIGVAPDNTAIHYFKVVLTGGTNVVCTVDSTSVTVSTNVPATGVSMRMAEQIVTYTTGVANLRIANIYATQ